MFKYSFLLPFSLLITLNVHAIEGETEIIAKKLNPLLLSSKVKDDPMVKKLWEQDSLFQKTVCS